MACPAYKDTVRKFLIVLLFVQGCALFKEAPFHKVVILPETVVHIRNDCDGDRGWAKDNEICVWGYEQNGVVPDYYILGHEIAHILQHADKEMRNPDEIRNID